MNNNCKEASRSKSGTITTTLSQSLRVRKADISEIRLLRTPPQVVVEVIACIAVLLGRKYVSWDANKMMLGDQSLPNQLKTLNWSKITPQQVETVKG